MTTIERRLYFLKRYFHYHKILEDMQGLLGHCKSYITTEELIHVQSVITKLREGLEESIESRFDEVMLQQATRAMEDAARPNPKNPTVVNWPGHNSNTK